jgi:lipopolysaccharide/colanic/teichoic acid biosynthesis glycosyltransferase
MVVSHNQGDIMQEILSYTTSQSSSLLGWLNALVKRLFDIVICVVGLILVSPLFALIAMAIKRDTPGPVFYQGKRVGRGGKVFRIFKFRTMYETSASYAGPHVTARDDSRITPLGRWLRDTKINELPQLLNVIRGDMSLVGPRPEDPELAKFWSNEVRDVLLSVRPGITSPASVQYRNEEFLLSSETLLDTYTEDLGPDKMRLDQIYVRNKSLLLDLDTILWTFLLLLPRISAHTPPEELLFVGPISRLMRRYINWFVIDLLVSFAAIGVTGVVWRSTGPLDVGWPISVTAAIGYSLLFSITCAIMGTNRIMWSKARLSDGYDLLPAWVVATILMCLSNEIFHIFPTKMVLVASGVALFGFVVIRYRSRLLTTLLEQMTRHWIGDQLGRERVLIIGTGALANNAAWLLNQPLNARKYWVVGFVDDDVFKQGERMYGARVVGSMKDIPSLVEKYDLGVIIQADYRLRSNMYREVAKLCNKTKARFVVLPDIMAAFRDLNKAVSTLPMEIESESDFAGLGCRQCMLHFSAPRVDKNEGSEPE